ncbi:uncharacterized protein [Equus przewalskii]|uniref:Uncharacterized protein isoform X4 n=1 Tax=Equus przewalskii TaxID=9798 RepID=A0ABM4QIE9_EQUPR
MEMKVLSKLWISASQTLANTGLLRRSCYNTGGWSIPRVSAELIAHLHPPVPVIMTGVLLTRNSKAGGGTALGKIPPNVPSLSSSSKRSFTIAPRKAIFLIGVGVR